MSDFLTAQTAESVSLTYDDLVAALHDIEEANRKARIEATERYLAFQRMIPISLANDPLVSTIGAYVSEGIPAPPLLVRRLEAKIREA